MPVYLQCDSFSCSFVTPLPKLSSFNKEEEVGVKQKVSKVCQCRLDCLSTYSHAAVIRENKHHFLHRVEKKRESFYGIYLGRKRLTISSVCSNQTHLCHTCNLIFSSQSCTRN